MPPNVENLIALPPGHRLGEYRIERCLGSGGFGITYSAVDEHLNRRVAIKEYLPKSLAIRDANDRVTVATAEDEADFRWGLDRFLDEARALARFDHPNIVGVKRFLEAHGTGYIVMEYVDGESLSEMLKRKATLTEREIREHVLPLSTGLEEVHGAGLLHRDIKPSNIVVRADGVPVLIDFGSARLAVNAKSRSLTAVVTPGYAPLEQYSAKGRQLPATDIYALGAVLYRCVTGVTPRDATERALEDRLAPVAGAADGVYSDGLLTAIHAALAMQVDDRPNDIAVFLNLVSTGDNECAIAETFDVAKKAYERSEYDFALREFSKLAGQGNADAQYELGEMYHGGIGVENDNARAVQWFTHAAEQGHIEAQFNLGRIHYEGVDVPKDEVQAIKWFTLAAEQGHDDAHLIMDYMAAEQGDAERQYEMGRMFDVEMRDERKFNAFSSFEWYGIFDEVMTIQNCEVLAEIWYRRAAEQGHVKAQRELGLLNTDHGDIVAKDIEVGTDSLTQAAECGDAEAQYRLGRMHSRSENILKHMLKRRDSNGEEALQEYYAQAVQWYRRAAEQGHVKSQYHLGLMYDLGLGVSEDGAQAVQWFRRAAEQGYVEAQYHLGFMYDTGKGVPEIGAQEAAQWYNRAAERGLAEAQYALSQMYEKGDGVQADNIQAYAWANLARVGGLEDAETLRDEIAANLSETQLAEAQHLSRELKARIQNSR